MWLSSHHRMGLDTFLYSLMAHATCHSKYLRVCNRKKKKQDLPCSFICLICFTVSFRIAHLSGLTLKLSMSLKLAKISSASSSMYLFSCSRLRFSLLRLGLKMNKKIPDQAGIWWKTTEMYIQTSTTGTKFKKRKVLQGGFKRGWFYHWFQKKSHLGPKSSEEQSLRFRGSALAGSDGVSPTPLIINAYQRLKNRHSTLIEHIRKQQNFNVVTELKAQSEIGKNIVVAGR